MKMGHSFHPMHGFTGSAKPSTDMSPTVPGFKRGGRTGVEHGAHHDLHDDHPKHKEHKKHKGMKHGGHMKHGGMAKEE